MTDATGRDRREQQEVTGGKLHSCLTTSRLLRQRCCVVLIAQALIAPN